MFEHAHFIQHSIIAFCTSVSLISRIFPSFGWADGEVWGKKQSKYVGEVTVAPSGISKTNYYE
jgi:hypothetical protein